MEMMILLVVLVFFALLGLANLVMGLRRWLAQSTSLGDSLLVLELAPEDDAAEAKLVQAVEMLQLTPGMEGVRLGVICPGGTAYAICECYCGQEDILLCKSWQMLPKAMGR